MSIESRIFGFGLIGLVILLFVSLFIWLFFIYLPKKTSKLKTIKDQTLVNGFLVIVGRFYYEGWGIFASQDTLSINADKMVINGVLTIDKKQIKNLILVADSLHIEYDQSGVSKFLLFVGGTFAKTFDSEWKSYLDYFGYSYVVQPYNTAKVSSRGFKGGAAIGYPGNVSFSIYDPAPKSH